MRRCLPLTVDVFMVQKCEPVFPSGTATANLYEAISQFIVHCRVKSNLGNFKFQPRLKWEPWLLFRRRNRCYRATLEILEGIDFRLDATVWVMLDLDIIELEARNST